MLATEAATLAIAGRYTSTVRFMRWPPSSAKFFNTASAWAARCLPFALRRNFICFPGRMAQRREQGFGGGLAHLKNETTSSHTRLMSSYGFKEFNEGPPGVGRLPSMRRGALSSHANCRCPHLHVPCATPSWQGKDSLRDQTTSPVV